MKLIWEFTPEPLPGMPTICPLSLTSVGVAVVPAGDAILIF
jgi:hypothetical protein